MDDKPIVELPEVENKQQIIDSSGVKIWRNGWRERIKEHKKFVVIVTILSILLWGSLFASTSYVLENSRLEKRLVESETQRRRAESRYSDAQDNYNSSQARVAACTQAVETAWKAWARRNDVIVDFLDNIFASNTEAIELDNTQAALDFLDAERCAPYLDADEIFGS